MKEHSAWPLHSRILRNHTIDSSRWDCFRFRDGDVVIASWAKAGTTWLQQIVAQLMIGPPGTLVNLQCSPWIEHRFCAKDEMYRMLEAQKHRRFVKTHLPVYSLVYSARAKYIYIARDGRDVIWSWYRHQQNLAPAVYTLINEWPDRAGPELLPPRGSFQTFFNDWLDRDGYPLWPFWSHVRSWWEVQHLPNVLLVHFQSLRSDLAKEVHRIAKFLEIEIGDEQLNALATACSFSNMRENAAHLSRSLENAFVGGAKAFFDRGESKGWAGHLDPSDLEKYDLLAKRELGELCAQWLSGAN